MSIKGYYAEDHFGVWQYFFAAAPVLTVKEAGRYGADMPAEGAGHTVETFDSAGKNNIVIIISDSAVTGAFIDLLFEFDVQESIYPEDISK